MVGLIDGQLGDWSPELARRKAIESAAARAGQMQGYMHSDVNVRPEFDYAQQANEARIKADTLNQNSAYNAANNTIIAGVNDAIAQQQASAQAALDAQAVPLPGFGGSQAPESPRMGAYMRALRKGSDLGSDEQIGAQMGSYGMSEQNLQNKQGGDKGGWDRQALGYDITTEEFLNSKKLQNQIARYKFGKYLNREGETGALEKWHDKTNNPLSLNTFLSQVLSSLKR